jgi:benzoyl-CoA reductase subunit C
MNSLERFHKVAQTPLGQWNDIFPKHRPVGIYNAYVPEELFHAAGLTPVYVFHQSVDHGYTRTHLPSFTCWPGRSLMDQALSGDLDGLSGMAFGQTCDTVQALTDIWRKAVPGVPVYHFGMPANLEGTAVRPYLIAELNCLRDALGNPSDDALRKACTVYNRTRELVRGLYDRAGDFKPTDFYAVLRANLLMPKEEFNQALQSLLDDLPPTAFRGTRLVLVGPHLADPTVYQIIEAAGARIVDDVLDVGHRYLDTPVNVSGDPVSGLAERLLTTAPTPTKHHPTRRRDQHLVQRVAQTRAHGVVFVRQKFCDPHGFDYASTIPTLDADDIPHLLMELEQASQVGQMHTRVEAFLETISP